MVEAIVKMPPPSDRQGIMRQNGMVTCLAWYMFGFTDVTSPIRELLEKENDFRWDDTMHWAAFVHVIDTICLEILWHHKVGDRAVWRVTEWNGHMHYTEWITNWICFAHLDGDRTIMGSDWKGIVCNTFCTGEVPQLCVRLMGRNSWNRS